MQLGVANDERHPGQPVGGSSRLSVAADLELHHQLFNVDLRSNWTLKCILAWAQFNLLAGAALVRRGRHFSNNHCRKSARLHRGALPRQTCQCEHLRAAFAADKWSRRG